MGTVCREEWVWSLRQFRSFNNYLFNGERGESCVLVRSTPGKEPLVQALSTSAELLTE